MQDPIEKPMHTVRNNRPYPKYFVRLFDNEDFAMQCATGKIYMNTLEYFRSIEPGFQGDPLEGKVLGKALHAELMVSSTDDFSKPDIVLKDVQISGNGYVYCFYAAEEDELKIVDHEAFYRKSIHPNLNDTILEYKKSHDKTYCIIFDAQKVISKIQTKLNKEKFKSYQGFVEYVPNVELSQARVEAHMKGDPWAMPFIKDEKYSYQKEWRVFIHVNPTEKAAWFWLENPSEYVLFFGEV